jgi:hypothetical protein
MKYPVGTVVRLQHRDGRTASEVVVYSDKHDYTDGWFRVGEVKYDPEPLKIGAEYISKDGLVTRAKIIGLHGGFVWYIYRGYDETDYKDTKSNIAYTSSFNRTYEPLAPSKED